MKKEHKINFAIVIVVILIVAGVAFFLLSKNMQTGSVKSISISELKEKIDNKDSFILVITQDGCSHCQNYAPIIREISEEYNIKIYDLNLTNLTKDEKDELINIANVNGTPTTLFFKNGEEESTLNRINGEASSSKLVNKLKKLGYIGD